ncbi:MAG: acetyltransferase [Candidatus Omnitrophica bacterium]|nr:acetyltransferase [Candidatus Omnitrophota bacterium]
MIKRYGCFGLLKFSISLIKSKLFYPKARLIRFPIDIRGKKYINYGEGFTTGRGCRIEAYPLDGKSTAIIIGKNVQINDYVHITGVKKVFIGNDVLIAGKVYISDSNHGNYSGSKDDSNPLFAPMDRPLFSKEVIIEDCVWIGESVSILPGVTVGRGSVIGANSVVTKNIPEYVIAVGSPARLIKKFNFGIKKWERL